MQTQISRSTMLAEEMTRVAIMSQPNRSITDMRLLEITLKSPILGASKTVEVSGRVIVFETSLKTTDKAREYWFKGTMGMITDSAKNWLPSGMGLQLEADKFSSGVEFTEVCGMSSYSWDNSGLHQIALSASY